MRRDDRDHAPERATSRVRVPKIQYRFIKELEQTGVGGEARVNALAMADKIKRYPLEAQHVMASWERFTKKSIEEFKARGKNDANDRQHVAYAVLFSAMRDAQPAQSIGDLKQRIELFAAKHPPQSADRPAQQSPQQQSLLDQQQRPIDRQVDASLTLLRGLTPQLRDTIEASARDAILEGQHTARSAREALPDAARQLQAEKSERATVTALTLAVVARTPEHKELLREVADQPRDEMKAIEAEGRARIERYSPATALADVRKDAVEAAVRAAVAGSAPARREALVLAETREQLECVADPKRALWQNVADELARDLA